MAASAAADVGPDGRAVPERAPRAQRADAQRNIGSLLEATKVVFATSGVDAPTG